MLNMLNMLPQFIYCSLMAMTLGIHLAKHGEPNETKYNFITAVIGIAIQLLLLWWGGFFG